MATSFADDADFSKYSTFSVADSIFFIGSNMQGRMVRNNFTESLTDEFRQMMEARGYTYVPIEKEEDNGGGDTSGSGDTGDSADGQEGETGSGSTVQEADLGVQLSYVYDTSYYVDYVNPYWWLGYSGYWSPYWSGAWYYPYPVTYEVTTHSLTADIADLTVTGDDEESHPILWNCYIDGTSGSGRSDLIRYRMAIRQAFEQSDYLKK